YGQRDLLQVVDALRAAGGLARRLDRGQEQRNQDGDNRDDHQQLDQRKASSTHGKGSRTTREDRTDPGPVRRPRQRSGGAARFTDGKFSRILPGKSRERCLLENAFPTSVALDLPAANSGKSLPSGSVSA